MKYFVPFTFLLFACIFFFNCSQPNDPLTEEETNMEMDMNESDEDEDDNTGNNEDSNMDTDEDEDDNTGNDEDNNMDTDEDGDNDNSEIETTGLTDWMSKIDDNTKLQQFSIPGTHQSGALFEFLVGTSKNQELTIGEQLKAGTRFLDIRCRHVNDSFHIQHGIIFQYATFDEVLATCLEFLANEPTEAILMSIKQEHTPDNNTRSFEETLDFYIQMNMDKWYLDEEVPTMGSARGKIVLFNRFSSTDPLGIDVSIWDDNTTFDLTSSSGNFKIQDNYEVTDTNTKWEQITMLLDAASSNNSDTFYINFTSGFETIDFIGRELPQIHFVSNAINPRIEKYFTPQKYGRFGIVVMDFVNPTRNNLIIQSNFP